MGVAVGNLPVLAWKECVKEMPHAVALFSVACVISSSFEDTFSVVCSLLEKRGDASYQTSIESAWSALRGEVKEFLNKAGCVCKQEGLCSDVKGVGEKRTDEGGCDGTTFISVCLQQGVALLVQFHA